MYLADECQSTRTGRRCAVPSRVLWNGSGVSSAAWVGVVRRHPEFCGMTLGCPASLESASSRVLSSGCSMPTCTASNNAEVAWLPCPGLRCCSTSARRPFVCCHVDGAKMYHINYQHSLDLHLSIIKINANVYHPLPWIISTCRRKLFL